MLGVRRQGLLPDRSRRACPCLLRACRKLSRLEHALEAHAGHEQRGEHGHVPRGLVAHLVVDAQAAVALQATERLLDLPAPRLADEAPSADRADELLDDAVAGEELAAAPPGWPARTCAGPR